MNQEEYLNRIKYSGELKPTPEILRQLQRAHLLAIPFENLDIHYKIPIELNINNLYTKIVIHNRGGFCYELNGLFYELLRAAGFETKRISARVYVKNKGYGNEYDHLAVIVSFNGSEYLTDVGFGEFAFGPLRLELHELQNDERGTFVIEPYGQNDLRVSRVENGESIPEYIFRNIHRELHEFEEMCRYHQTSMDSHFTQKKLISIPTKTGRITLTTEILKIKENDLVTETAIKDEAEFNDKLWNHFRIRIKK